LSVGKGGSDFVNKKGAWVGIEKQRVCFVLEVVEKNGGAGPSKNFEKRFLFFQRASN